MFATGAVLDSFQSTAAAPRLVRGAITYAAGSTGAIGSTTLFTVTGDVAITFLAAKCTTDLTSAGAPTWTLGVVGNTALWSAGSSAPDVTGWDTGEWYDANAAAYSLAGGSSIPNGDASQWVSGAAISANIIQTIAAATITGGVVRWYVSYIPLSGDGAVALHANLAAF